MTDGNGKHPRPGDPCRCDKCRGRLVVYTTRLNFVAGFRVRYLACGQCGDTPPGNKWVLPLEYAPARKR